MRRAADERDIEREPTVARASTTTWRRWLSTLLTYGRQRLAALGLTLVLGFLLGLGALFAFAALAEDVAHSETMQMDNAVLAWLHQLSSPELDALARGISLLGSQGLAVILGLLLIAFVWRRRWGAAVGLMVVTGGAQLLNDVLKELFHRTRPAPDGGSLFIAAQSFSFPSGHAMVSAAFYLFLAYLAWRLLRGSLRVAAVVLAVGLVLLIGLSRLYLGVHYFSDVVAGYVAGFFWTDAVILAGRLLGRSRAGVTRPTAHQDEVSAAPTRSAGRRPASPRAGS